MFKYRQLEMKYTLTVQSSLRSGGYCQAIVMWRGHRFAGIVEEIF